MSGRHAGCTPKKTYANINTVCSHANTTRSAGKVSVTVVPERKYGAWPAHIRTAFEAARTVKTGKPTFMLKPNTP